MRDADEEKGYGMLVIGGQDTLTIGVVGYGYWGPKLVRNLSETPQAALTWVADLDAERLARLRRELPGAAVTQNYDEMLASDIDAVVVATPIRTHYRLAKAALLAGKHVMVEKPLTANSREADELTRLAEERGLTLMVGHTFEYNAAIRALRNIVRSGELGRIYYVDSARLNLGLFQSDINVVWDLAPHDLSILLYVLGMDPLAVSARGSANVRPGDPRCRLSRGRRSPAACWPTSTSAGSTPARCAA